MTDEKNEEIKEQTGQPEAASPDVDVDATQEEVSARDLLQTQEQQIADLENRLLRLHADFDNYRRRSLRERDEQLALAEADLLRGLLPVLDNFERALASLTAEGEAAWVDGIRLVHRQLVNTLAQQGLQVVDCTNQSFDPNLHEAVMRDESGDSPDGTILQELQCGYQYKGRLLRPSMVKVASQS